MENSLMSFLNKYQHFGHFTYPIREENICVKSFRYLFTSTVDWLWARRRYMCCMCPVCANGVDVCIMGGVGEEGEFSY